MLIWANDTCTAGSWSLACTFAQVYCCFTVSSPLPAKPEVGLWFSGRYALFKEMRYLEKEISSMKSKTCTLWLLQSWAHLTYFDIWLCVCVSVRPSMCPEPPWFAPAAQQQPQVRCEDTTSILPTNHGPYADGTPPLPGHHQAAVPGQAPLPPSQHSRHQGRM